MRIDKYIKIFIFVACIAFLGRLYLAQYFTYYNDLNTFKYWSEYLTNNNLNSFYARVWSDYLPGYNYILWSIGMIKVWLINQNIHFNENVLYKLPSLITDILNGLFIFLIARKFTTPKKSLITACIYLFNPAILANSTFWGQAESFTSLFLLSSFYLLIQSNLWFSAVLLGFGQITKPITLLCLPIYLIFIYLNSHGSIKKPVIYLIITMLTSLVTFIPFNYQSNLFQFINERLQQTFNQYPYTSLNAFNFWAVVSDFWVPDKTTLLSISYQDWGYLFFSFLYGLLLSAMLFKLKKAHNRLLFMSFVMTICYLAMFIFFTRMHERHLFYGLTFLTLLIPIVPFLGIILIIIMFSTYILNLLFAYLQLIQKFLNWDHNTIATLAILNIIVLFYLTALFLFKYVKSK